MSLKPNQYDEDEVREDDEDVEETSSSPSSHKKVQMIMIVVIVTGLLAAILFYAFKSGNKEAPVETGGAEVIGTETGSGNGSKPWMNSSESGQFIPTGEDSQVTPTDDSIGIKDISGDTVRVNPFEIGDDEEVTKAFTGEKVKSYYEIAGMEYVNDFVSYTMHRNVTDEGVELYWLDAEYKGKQVYITVPFYIAKEMDPVGITLVEVETALVPDESGKTVRVVTGFAVRKDAVDKLKGGG